MKIGCWKFYWRRAPWFVCDARYSHIRCGPFGFERDTLLARLTPKEWK
jgi:hypothetical protein